MMSEHDKVRLEHSLQEVQRRLDALEQERKNLMPSPAGPRVWPEGITADYILQHLEGRGMVRIVKNRGHWYILSDIIAPFTVRMTGYAEATVRAGTIYIDGLGSWAMADTAISLTADPSYIYLRMAWTGGTPVALESAVSPAGDSQYYKKYLCKCQSDGAGHYSITDRRYLGGDIQLSAPLA